jgi:hypothetical protein
MDEVRERDTTPPPSKDRRWDIDERGAGIAEASHLAPRIGELERVAREPRWIAEQPDAHLWPHIERAVGEAGSPWTAVDYAIDENGTFVVDLVYEPVDRDRARALRHADALRLLGFVIESATYIEIEERRDDDMLVLDVVTGVLDDQTPFRSHGHTIRFRVSIGR